MDPRLISQLAGSVSYTHLDVYKRQDVEGSEQDLLQVWEVTDVM